ncbi:hypothetical protein ACFL6U_29815 [Planctomycetota bacterium]
MPARHRAGFQALQPGKRDEIGTAGVVWSHGRYDFVYDEKDELLRITYKYSHKHVDTQSVLTITKTMIDHALSYLEKVKASAEESTDTLETE